MEREQKVSKESIVAHHVEAILHELGEDVTREGLNETPKRVAKAYQEMLSGMGQDPTEPLKKQFNEGDFANYVEVRDIDFTSLCEHHMLPFYGKVNIAYRPRDGVVTGLSKFARCVDILSKRLQVQERLTTQIGKAVYKALDPLAVLVVVEATHMCMVMRGVQKVNSSTVTQYSYGFSEMEKQTILSRIK